jgi:glycosyltransferase involved in cell wall biosynthesis
MDGYRFDRGFIVSDPTDHRPDHLAMAAVRQNLAHRGHHLLHVHGEIAGAICLPGLVLRPSILTLHGLHLLRRTSGARRRLALANLRMVVRAATRTICVSEAEFIEAHELLGATARARLVVIRNGVDAPPLPERTVREAARAELGIAPSVLTGVYVGSLDAHKDPTLPARAVVEIGATGTPIALLVAGDGPLRSELERLARGPGGEAVRVLGYRADIRRVMAAADFFVSPSRREGLSFSVLEAMAAGLVPVVSDAPGNPEVVGATGVIVARGDTAGLVAAIRSLVDDPCARVEMSRKARERVAGQFRVDEMVRATRELYDEVTGQMR